MIRTQIQLTERQASVVKEMAAREDISMAEVIRQAIDRLVADAERRELRRRALEALGGFPGGPPDGAENHDKYLDEAYLS